MGTKESQYGQLGSIGITDEGLEYLKSLPKNSKGVRNLSFATHKNDAAKFSVWENTFVPKNTSIPSSVSNDDTGDDLPF